MKLSKEAEEYADDYYFNKGRDIQKDATLEFKKRPSVGFRETEIDDFSMRISTTAKFVQARLESYLNAYEKEDKIIDDEDRQEIFETVNRIIGAQLDMIFSRSQGAITMARNQGLQNTRRK